MSQWISSLDLWFWPTVALILFMSAGVAITCLILHMGRRHNLQQLAERVLRDAPEADADHSVPQRNTR